MLRPPGSARPRPGRAAAHPPTEPPEPRPALALGPALLWRRPRPVPMATRARRRARRRPLRPPGGGLGGGRGRAGTRGGGAGAGRAPPEGGPRGRGDKGAAGGRRPAASPSCGRRGPRGRDALSPRRGRVQDQTWATGEPASAAFPPRSSSAFGRVLGARPSSRKGQLARGLDLPEPRLRSGPGRLPTSKRGRGDLGLQSPRRLKEPKHLLRSSLLLRSAPGCRFVTLHTC